MVNVPSVPIGHAQRPFSTAIAAFLQQALQNPVTAILFGPDQPDRFAALHALADLED